MNARSVIAAVLLPLALPCAAEVYRCEIDGVTTFSDRPCGESATRHVGGKGISFVTPDENLPALAEAAQAFIKERRERLARRNERPEAPPQASTQAPRERVETVYFPWPSRDMFDADRRQTPDQRVGNGVRPPNPAQERYSPLNGPILGTSPDSAAFERRNADRNRHANRRRDQ